MSLAYYVIQFFTKKCFLFYLMVSSITFAWKGWKLPYNPWAYWLEIGLIGVVSILHLLSFTLSYIDQRILSGVVLCPSILASVYFLIWQTYVLRIEIFSNSLMMIFQVSFIVSNFLESLWKRYFSDYS